MHAVVSWHSLWLCTWHCLPCKCRLCMAHARMASTELKTIAHRAMSRLWPLGPLPGRLGPLCALGCIRGPTSSAPGWMNLQRVPYGQKPLAANLSHTWPPTAKGEVKDSCLCRLHADDWHGHSQNEMTRRQIDTNAFDCVQILGRNCSSERDSIRHIGRERSPLLDVPRRRFRAGRLLGGRAHLGLVLGVAQSGAQVVVPVRVLALAAVTARSRRFPVAAQLRLHGSTWPPACAREAVTNCTCAWAPSQVGSNGNPAQANMQKSCLHITRHQCRACIRPLVMALRELLA